jgi:hypothetical protein
MAVKTLANMLQQIGTTGLSQLTVNVLTSTGNSQEFYEFASADAARFYLDVSAVSGSGSIKFTLNERDPATGVFFAANPAADPIFNGTGVTGTTTTPLVSTVDPVYPECLQVTWLISGFTSVTCSLVAELIKRDG